ncbi:DUF2190 family protein [Vineibacter terrae]|uniref:DUF2190 family protein n=1 Tax=Vineibacter terrae TaxID=2586908 RepID=A0A5C8PA53_9HYPH|nr:DUF2190 family protein [Vineibacter terrae]TXL70108.1 DUF2190 family protein [Vineibacter terrae]
MRNYVQLGVVVEVIAPYLLASGDGCQVGAGLFGVATTDAANGAKVNIHTLGVFDLKAEPSVAWSVGDKIYWDNTNKRGTKTATSNLLIGVALAAKGGGAGDTLGRIRLNGVVPA